MRNPKTCFVRKVGPLEAAIRRLIARLALEKIECQPGSRRVHTIRVTLKRFRALLRLAATHIPSAEFERLDALASGLKRQFSASRDEEVLSRLARDLFGRSTAAALGIWPFKFSQKKAPHLPSVRRLAKQLRSYLQTEWFIEPPPKSVDEAREKTHRAARAWMRRCISKNADEELFHEWRKSIKTVIYQNEFEIGNVLKRQKLIRLRHLAHILGYYHDLCLLESRLSGETHAATMASEIIAIVRREKRKARRCALRVGVSSFRNPESL